MLQVTACGVLCPSISKRIRISSFLHRHGRGIVRDKRIENLGRIAGHNHKKPFELLLSFQKIQGPIERRGGGLVPVSRSRWFSGLRGQANPTRTGEQRGSCDLVQQWSRVPCTEGQRNPPGVEESRSKRTGAVEKWCGYVLSWWGSGWSRRGGWGGQPATMARWAAVGGSEVWCRGRSLYNLEMNNECIYKIY